VITGGDGELILYYTTHTNASYTPGSFLCLAKSADGGKTWAKPVLDLVEFDGSTAGDRMQRYFH
jgi:hypothetical protein